MMTRRDTTHVVVLRVTVDTACNEPAPACLERLDSGQRRFDIRPSPVGSNRPRPCRAEHSPTAGSTMVEYRRPHPAPAEIVEAAGRRLGGRSGEVLNEVDLSREASRSASVNRGRSAAGISRTNPRSISALSPQHALRPTLVVPQSGAAPRPARLRSCEAETASHS